MSYPARAEGLVNRTTPAFYLFLVLLKSLRWYEGFRQIDRTWEEKPHTIHTPIVCFWSYMSLAGIQNVRDNGSCLWASKCKKANYWKSRVYIVNHCHVIVSKHTLYFARDKIKGADVVGSINHVTSLTNRFSKLISLPASTIFVSESSKSVSYFLEFSFITVI